MYDTQQLPQVEIHAKYMAIFISPTPPHLASEPQLLPHGMGSEFHNLTSGQNEHNNA